MGTFFALVLSSVETIAQTSWRGDSWCRPGWLFAFLALVFSLRFWKKEKFSFLTLVFLGAVGLTSAFLAHQRSTFIWNKISLLAYLQFPWRFLALVIFAFSIMAGAGVSYFKKYFRLVGVLFISGGIF